MILSLIELQKKSASRPPGYLQDILSLATVEGDAVELSNEDYKYFRQKYQPQPVEVARSSECGCCKQVQQDTPIT